MTTLFKHKTRSFALVMALFMLSMFFILLATFFSVSTNRVALLKSQGDSYNVDLVRETILSVIIHEMRRSLSENDTQTLDLASKPNNRYFIPNYRTNFYLTYPSSLNSGHDIVLTSGNDGATFSMQGLSAAELISSPKRMVHNPNFWNMPGFTEISESEIPKWIYLQKDGEVLSQGQNLDSQNLPSYRFAFVLHDIGGLFDVNLVGQTSGDLKLRADGNPTVAFADISHLPGFTTAMQEALVKFRSVSRTSLSDSSRFEKFTNDWSSTGCIKNPQDQNAFASRQDLIQFYKNQGWPTDTLKYFTTFSRSIERPFYRFNNQTGPINSTNCAWTNLFAKSDFTRFDGTKAQKGEPLIARYFPLSWISKLEDSSSEAAFIEKAFGLKKQPDGKWLYTGGTGAVVSSINTASQVASLNREMNFFELLKLGVVEGSLGGANTRNNNVYTNAASYAVDSSKDYQIMRIGANIIDQYDADHYPTTVTFNNCDFYGIEDLPYLNKLVQKIRYNNSTNGINSLGELDLPFYFNVLPELWNPHRKLTTSTNAPYPAIRVKAQANSGLYQGYNDLNTGTLKVMRNDTGYAAGIKGFDTNPTTLDSNCLTTNNYFREPSLIRGASGLNLASAVVSTNFAGQNISGYSFSFFDSSTGVKPTTNTYKPDTGRIGFVNSAILAEYQNSSGQWTPYHTFFGQMSNNVCVGTVFHTNFNYLISSTTYTNAGKVYVKSLSTPDENWMGSIKADPRTTRYGYSAVKTSNKIPVKPMEDLSIRPNLPEVGLFNKWIYTQRMGYAGTFYGVASVAENRYVDTTAGSNPSHDYNADPDHPNYNSIPGPASPTTVPGHAPDLRWGDYGLEQNNISTPSLTINPYESGVDTYRPILLDRPFRSVGELGYVYRDQPMKSLNYFTKNSGDLSLLDLFSTYDAPDMVAGKLAINCPYPEIWKCLIVGATRAYAATDFQTISTTEADTLSKYIVNSMTNYPVSRGDFIQSIANTNTVSAEWHAFKHHREAIVRQLGEVAQTTTLNLFLDLVIEEGKTISSESGGYKFNTNAARHFWVSFAMDRLTYKILDIQIEEVRQ